MSFGTDQEDLLKGRDPESQWTTGLAARITVLAKAIVTDAYVDSAFAEMADAVEELVNSAEGIDFMFKTIAEIYPDLYLDSAPPLQRFRTAVLAAKNWDRDYTVIKCPDCLGDSFITLPGEQFPCKKCCARDNPEVPGRIRVPKP